MSVVSLKQQQTLPLFPTSNEQHSFAFWFMKARSAFLACDLSMYIDRPVAGMPVFECDRSVQHGTAFQPKYDHEVEFIGSAEQDNVVQKHSRLACTAYNMIMQSLNEKQLSMTQDIFGGNAYMLMHRLKRNYELSNSTTSVQILLARLDEMKRVPVGKDNLNEYFARLESMMHQIAVMSPGMMTDEAKKLHFKQALVNDSYWKDHILITSHLDAGGQWTADQF